MVSHRLSAQADDPLDQEIDDFDASAAQLGKFSSPQALFLDSLYIYPLILCFFSLFAGNTKMK